MVSHRSLRWSWATLCRRPPGLRNPKASGSADGSAGGSLLADSSFATFDEVARDRLSQHTGIWPPAFWPVVHLGFGYARLRYGLDLHHAAPIDAIRATNVPILLIHGMKDRNIPPRHSRELHAANPRTVLWEVPAAGQVQSYATDPQEYARRAVAWFQIH